MLHGSASFEELKEDHHCHLLFLDRQPEPERRAALMAKQADGYRFEIRGRVLYYCYPRAAAGSPNKANQVGARPPRECC